MKKYEYFDVTADIGFKAYGNDLNEAFENADTSNVDSSIAKSFEITSEDEVSLLYDYLEELLFYHEVDFMLFCDFDVEIKRIDDAFNLKAKIKGESINWNKHERKTEIKAITFHMMDVKKTSHYELQAIVDL